jgi:hypothetical protein
MTRFSVNLGKNRRSNWLKIYNEKAFCDQAGSYKYTYACNKLASVIEILIPSCLDILQALTQENMITAGVLVDVAKYPQEVHPGKNWFAASHTTIP